MNYSKNTKKIIFEALLVCLSIWIEMIEHQISVSGMQFLHGIHLIPILFVNDLFGFRSGCLCLFAASFVRFLFASKAGILGLIMRLTPCIYMLFRKNAPCKISKIILFDLIGLTLTVLCKIPLHCLFFKTILRFDTEQIKGVFLSYIVFTNFARYAVAVLISRLINLRKYVKKNLDFKNGNKCAEINEQNCD